MYLYFTNCSQCYILDSLIFLVSVFNFFPNGTDSCARKSVLGESNFLPALLLSRRPLTNNGHFPLVKVAVIERLDCT